MVVAVPESSSWQPESNRQELTRQTRITALPSNAAGNLGAIGPLSAAMAKLTQFIRNDPKSALNRSATRSSGAADRQAGISSLKELQSGLGLQTPEPSIFRGNAGQYRIKASSNSILLCCAEESWRHTTGLCNFAS